MSRFVLLLLLATITLGCKPEVDDANLGAPVFAIGDTVEVSSGSLPTQGLIIGVTKEKTYDGSRWLYQVYYRSGQTQWRLSNSLWMHKKYDWNELSQPAIPPPPEVDYTHPPHHIHELPHFTEPEPVQAVPLDPAPPAGDAPDTNETRRASLSLYWAKQVPDKLQIEPCCL